MPLNFPNVSRSYDPVGKRIRFAGYDGTFEIPFFIEVEALASIAKGMGAEEADYLAAFDRSRNAVLQAARTLYARGRKRVIVLTADDVR